MKIKQRIRDLEEQVTLVEMRQRRLDRALRQVLMAPDDISTTELKAKIFSALIGIEVKFDENVPEGCALLVPDKDDYSDSGKIESR